MATRVLFGGCLIFALFASVTPVIAQTPEGDLSGVYACKGTNPDGSAYEGVVDIVKLDDTYLVRWTMGEVKVVGVGILMGDHLAVSYFGGSPAIVVYTTTRDGKLDGRWTAGATVGAVFVETLSKITAARAKPVEPAQPATRAPATRRRAAAL